MAVKFTGEVGQPSQRQPVQMDLEAYLEKLKQKGLGPDGRLLPDPKPMAPPVGFKRQPSMVEIVRDLVRSEKLAQEVRDAGAGTFEEEDDFDVGDDPDLLRSPFENEGDPPVSELVKEGGKVVAEREAKARKPPSRKAPEAPELGPEDPIDPEGSE